jgi:hypothetical protein
MQFKNYWYLNTGINPEFSGRSNDMLRGGPSILYPGSINTWLNIGSDQRRKLTCNGNTSQTWGMEKNRRNQNYSLYISYKPVNALSISLNPFLSLSDRNMQYVTTMEFEPEDRYIYASIDQKTLGLSLRLNLSITPNFTLQYWGQPFISAGEYTDFKKITDPNADLYTDRYYTFSGNEITYNGTDNIYEVVDEPGLAYSFDNPDFNIKEFKSNFVARWEYVPGSTLFIVWTQGRNRYNSYGEFDPQQDMTDMFDIHPHDIFLIKLSYRFGL